MEFLVKITFDPSSVPAEQLDELLKAERLIAADMKARGTIQRMWRITDQPATASIWRADSADALRVALDLLPLRSHLDVDITPLSTHYLEE